MGTRTVLGVAALACTLAVFSSARGADTAARPTEVPEGNWIALGGGLGFVVERERVRGAEKSVEGHFMVRHAGGWWRLEAHGGPLLLPTSACPDAKPHQVPSRPKLTVAPSLHF